MKIKELLEAEIETELNELNDIELGSDVYESTIDGLVKLMDRKIEMDKNSLELEEKIESRKIENELKIEQMSKEKKDDFIRNGIAIAGIIIPTIVTIWGTCKTLKFEETGTITTSMGRGFINKLLPKK